MRKIPISGGPHTGKTTLLNALREEFPQAFFVAEPAELVISDQLEREKSTPPYKGIFPWDGYPAFSRLAINKSIELEAGIPQDADVVFQDRSLIDNIGYGRMLGYEDLIPEVNQHLKVAKYAFALFCEPVGTYTPTEIRRETPEDAIRTHEQLARAYDESGIPIIHLPAVPVPERIAIIREALGFEG